MPVHPFRWMRLRRSFQRVLRSLPHVQGTINGESFKGFKETDNTLTYFIEAIEYERYLWVPIANIRELTGISDDYAVL